MDVLKTDGNFDISQVNITCTQLQSRYQSYASYHVAVAVGSDRFSVAIDRLMCNDLWPEGILVRRYFNKKKDG